MLRLLLHLRPLWHCIRLIICRPPSIRASNQFFFSSACFSSYFAAASPLNLLSVGGSCVWRRSTSKREKKISSAASIEPAALLNSGLVRLIRTSYDGCRLVFLSFFSVPLSPVVIREGTELTTTFLRGREDRLDWISRIPPSFIIWPSLLCVLLLFGRNMTDE